MPKYKVISKGFYDGQVYDPTGKRKFVHTDKPLKPVPSWMKTVKAETVAEKKKRLEAEKIVADAAKKSVEDDKKEIADASFMGAGENTAPGEKTSKVETL